MAAALFAFGGQAWADDCSTTIDSNDMMRFDKTEMTVPSSCESFTVNLTHSGQLDKAVMGHNWVLTKSADAQGVASESFQAGLDNNYLKPGDERVLAATKIIGGGESASITFAVNTLSKDGSYTFFCSFPGHISIMQGKLTLT